MVSPSVTCIMPAFRPGGLCITFAGLRDQTFKDFEFIIVDRRYEKRHDAVMRLAKESGVRTIHVPEHRRNGRFAVTASAWNTGFMLARGDLILMMPDYAYVPPDWIIKHVETQKFWGKCYLLSPYTFMRLPPIVDRAGCPVEVPGPEEASGLPPKVTEQPGENFDEISLFSEPFDPSWVEKLEPWPGPLQCARATGTFQDAPLFWHIHFRNESVWREDVVALRGLDETLDRGKALIDSEFGRRISKCRFPVISNPENPCWMLNPRSLFPTMPYAGPGRWDYSTCEGYALNTGGMVAPNPYDWDERSKALAAWRDAEAVAVDGLDVPDEVYYK